MSCLSSVAELRCANLADVFLYFPWWPNYWALNRVLFPVMWVLLTMLPQALFVFQKNGPQFFGAERLTTLPQAFFDFSFSEKLPPYVWKPWKSDYVVAGTFFLMRMSPKCLEALNVWLRCRKHFFCVSGECHPPYFGLIGDPWLSSGGWIWELVK